MKPKDGLLILTLIIILMGGLLIYSLALSPDSFGFYHDDSIYVTTAKSLAEGQGYSIISLPGEPAQTKYPPLYPFLLSLIWRAFPKFPENLSALMFLSIVATLSTTTFAWSYLTKYQYASSITALSVVGLFALNSRTQILATGIYSEMIYTAFSIAALYLTEKYEKDKNNWQMGLALGVIIGLAILTRTLGVVLLPTLLIYFFMLKKLRKAWIPIIIGGIIFSGWILWSSVHQHPDGRVNISYYTNYIRDVINIVSTVADHTERSGLVTYLSLIGKNVILMIPVFAPLVCLGIGADWAQSTSFFVPILGFLLVAATFIFTLNGFIKTCSGGIRLLHIYIILYVILHLLWPYAVYERFLIPILPFLLLFLIEGLKGFFQIARKSINRENQIGEIISGIFVGGVMICVVGVVIFNYSSYTIRLMLSNKDKQIERATPDIEAMNWIRAHSEPEDVLVCYRDAKYYLYTGRKAIRSAAYIYYSGEQDNQNSYEEQSAVIARIIDENQARYIILTSTDMELEYQSNSRRRDLMQFLDENSVRYLPVFESIDKRCRIYKNQNHAN